MRPAALPPLALAASLAAACGASVDLTPFDPPRCVAELPSLEGLEPSSPVDYVELRAYDEGLSEEFRVLASAGVRCGGASDRAACEALVASTVTDRGLHRECRPSCVAYYLVTTWGELVVPVTDLPAFLGRIDDAREAALLVWGSGFDISCAGDKSRGAVREVPDGFEVIATRGTGCGDDVVQYVLAVDPAGGVREESRRVIVEADESCII